MEFRQNRALELPWYEQHRIIHKLPVYSMPHVVDFDFEISRVLVGSPVEAGTYHQKQNLGVRTSWRLS